MSVKRADLRVVLGPKLYKIDGVAPKGMRKREGVLKESDTSSAREVSREVRLHDTSAYLWDL